MNGDYSIIETIKESERVKVSLAAVDGIAGPVIVKEVRNADISVYRALKECENVHIPRVYDIRIPERSEAGTNVGTETAAKTYDEEVSTSRTDVVIIEEYVDGETLATCIRDGRYSKRELLTLMLQLCDALECIHTMNPPLIHRDIKPSNIIVNKDGVLKLIDFDASRRYKRDEHTTSDTILLGTAEYAAPEQFGYQQTNEQSDIYSFGVLLADMFGIRIREDVVKAGDELEEFSRKSRRRKRIESIIAKCTQFDPGQRYAGIAEVRKALQGVLNGRCSKKTVIASAIAAAVVLAGAVTVVLICSQNKAFTEKELRDEVSTVNNVPAGTDEKTTDNGPEEGARDTAVTTKNSDNNITENPEEKRESALHSELNKITFTGGETIEDIKWTYRDYTTLEDLMGGREAPDYLTEEYVTRLKTVEGVLLNSFRFVVHYYPQIEPFNDLNYRNRWVDNEGMRITAITLKDLMTQEEIRLTADDWYCTDHIVFIRRDALADLREGFYDIMTDIEFERETESGPETVRVRDMQSLNVNAVETDPARMRVCPFDCLCVDPNSIDFTAFAVPHNVDRRIVSLVHTADGSLVDPANYRISGDGRIVCISDAEFANPPAGDGYYYDVVYDDGSSQSVSVFV